ncbi:MAG: head decoration protein [Burkholderiales bacterium]|nr:head decoration protein [Burkholderiales bacterium]
MTQDVTTSQRQDYDGLFSGATCPVITGTEILTKGQNLKRGAVLGLVPSTQKMVLVNKSAVDDSKNPYAVLAEDVDATAADVIIPVYYSGEFNVSHLTFAAGTAAADMKHSARLLQLFFNNVTKG